MRDSEAPLQSVRTRLPADVLPGDRVAAALRVEAPPWPGRWRLGVTLVDERAGWFDEWDGGSIVSRIVEVDRPGARPADGASARAEDR
jgi:hypothetical protein